MTDIPFTPQIQKIIGDARAWCFEMEYSGLDLDLFALAFCSRLSSGCGAILNDASLAHTIHKECAKVVEKKRKSPNPSSEIKPDLYKFLKDCENVAWVLFELDYIPAEVILLNLLNIDLAPKAFRTLFIQDGELNNLGDSIFDRANAYILDDELFSGTIVDKETSDIELEEAPNILPMFSNNPVLSRFATNLNIEAKNGEFSDVIDFDGKVEELATILCRKKKPNAILVGVAGGGKTSTVFGLAHQIVHGKAPELLINKVIYSLNLSSMVAGTQYRGQFEERLEQFVEEAKKYDNLILFIDEIHTLVGAGGGTASSLEASNILKPELAKGTISCIGATTINEYTQTIKKDSALDRRFERVNINEPSPFQMKELLPKLTQFYEHFHNVTYSQEFLDSVVDYCELFSPHKHYPDKAIDVLDHCGAQAKVSFWKVGDDTREVQDKIFEVEDPNDREVLVEQLQAGLKEWATKVSNETPEVTLEHLKDFFEKRRNPLNKSEILNTVVYDVLKGFAGSKTPFLTLKDQITLSNLGLGKSSSHRPSVFGFIGSQNSGKSHLCGLLKDALSKCGANIIRYNGIHFSDNAASYKIVYNGQNTSLCEQVCINPNSIIIIDDFDKLGEVSRSLFSQIFKEGKMQMHNGDIADFSNCVFFVTSGIKTSQQLGFNQDNNKPESLTPQSITKNFDYEMFLKDLDDRGLRRVLYQKLSKMSAPLSAKGVKLDWDFEFLCKFIVSLDKKEKKLQSLAQKIEEEIQPYVMSEALKNRREINLKKLLKSPQTMQ